MNKIDMIWKHSFDSKTSNQIHKKTMVEHLGIELTEQGEDYLKGTMPVDHRTIQPYGLLHGGASLVLAETLGSVAAWMVIENPLDYKVVGTEINASHLYSAKSGKVTGICKPLKIGKTLQSWEIKIYNDDDKLCCISRLTTMSIKNKG